MEFSKRIIVAAAAAVVASVGALAAGSGQAQAPAPPPRGYLTPAQLPDSVAVLPKPPADGSPAETADREAFRITRALAGGPRWNQAVSDIRIFEPGAFDSFSCAAAATISQAAAPATWTLLRRSVFDAGGGTNPAKEHYNRPRPFLKQEGPVCLKPETLGKSASYPSGHASAGWAWALILAELRPERASQVLARGRDFGDSRVVCGVHYPSDVESGRTYGAAVVARLHADPVFMKDLEAARAELARGVVAPTGCGG